MKNPKNNLQEVLLTMIQKGRVSIFDFPYLSGFRTRVSELRRKHNLKFRTVNDTRCNKFGNPYTYSIHILEDKEQAINLYNKLCSNN